MPRNAKTTVDGPSTRQVDHRPAPVLRVVHEPSGGIAGRDISLSPGRHLIGRDVDDAEGVCLDDGRASRVHATLHVVSRSLRVRIADEDSRHGTWVNGERVDERWLEDGDVVRIGDTHALLRFTPPDLQDSPIASLLGRAPSIALTRHAIQSVATHEVGVMILGESGSGKEVVARAIHEVSGRGGRFVAINCAAIPEQLAESQLFGHVAGAFTGAKEAVMGFFRSAEGGTAFLDEIGDMPLALQPKLLRALEQREVTPVGANRPVAFDARVLVATHRNLEDAVNAGAFRGDLYARLAQFQLQVPPLRERREDVLALLANALRRPDPNLEPDLVAALLGHAWPYNVRELFAVAGELDVRGAGKDCLTLAMVAHRLARPGPRLSQIEPDRAIAPADNGEGAWRDGAEAPPSERRRGRDSGPHRGKETGPHRGKETGPHRGKETEPHRGSETEPASDAGAPPKPAPTQREFEQLVKDNQGNVRAIARATGRSRMQVYRWVEQYGIDLARYRD